MTNIKTLATFATTLRASSLLEDLRKAGISATAERPKWVNKRRPPPNVIVSVEESDFERASEVLKGFK